MAISEGWDSLLEPQTHQETDEEKQKRHQHKKDFVATFSSDYGKRVLDYFKSHTVDSPTWVPGFVEGQAQWREGQNSIIREIENTIKVTKHTEE